MSHGFIFKDEFFSPPFLYLLPNNTFNNMTRELGALGSIIIQIGVSLKNYAFSNLLFSIFILFGVERRGWQNVIYCLLFYEFAA